MEIAFVLPGRGLSGGIRVTVVMANKLLNKGHSIRLKCRKHPISLKSVSQSILDNKLFLKPQNWLDDFNGEKIEYFKDITDCTFKKNEIIIGVGMWASGQLIRLNSFSNQLVQYIHGASPWNMKMMEETLSQSIPKILVTSYLRPIVESLNGGDILAVIPNGINRQEYFNVVNESEKNGIGTIYSSSIAKAPKTTIKLFKKLAEEIPNVPLRLFGYESKPRELKNLFYRRAPSVKVSREIYSRSLVWLLTSTSEGFPAPILEAMSCGCVVISTDCGGTRDIIKDGENGFLVEVDNIQQMIDRINLVLNDKSLRTKIKRESQKTVEKFNWDNSITKLENVLMSLNQNIK